jgi:hypothetical protein
VQQSRGQKSTHIVAPIVGLVELLARGNPHAAGTGRRLESCAQSDATDEHAQRRQYGTTLPLVCQPRLPVTETFLLSNPRACASIPPCLACRHVCHATHAICCLLPDIHLLCTKEAPVTQGNRIGFLISRLERAARAQGLSAQLVRLALSLGQKLTVTTGTLHHAEVGADALRGGGV